MLNAFASYMVTSSTTWGYDGKFKDFGYYKYLIFNRRLSNFTRQELSRYDGSDAGLPIYVSIYGEVYDVTRSKVLYGPKGHYRNMAGKESARMLITGCLTEPDQYTADLRGLDLDHAMAEILQWQKYYQSRSKYWLVGEFHENYESKPVPRPCKSGLKVPPNVRS